MSMNIANLGRDPFSWWSKWAEISPSESSKYTNPSITAFPRRFSCCWASHGYTDVLVVTMATIVWRGSCGWNCLIWLTHSVTWSHRTVVAAAAGGGFSDGVITFHLGKVW